MDEIVDAIERINGDYPRHRRAAASIARDFFGHDVVLKRLLRDLGERVSRVQSVRTNSSSIPPSLVLAPISRWPTRLPAETVQTALTLPTPVVACEKSRSGRRGTVVVVTHQGLHYTKMCSTSLLSDWHPNDELIFVDNASTDGTREYLLELKALNPFVRVILNEHNRGFSAANSQALAQSSGDSVILLNNDTLVPDGWRDRLLHWLDDLSIGLVGPVTNRTCNEAQIDIPYRTFCEFERFAHDYTSRRAGEGADIRMLAFFCVAFRREILDRVGPLDERFEVGMFEDDDYAIRVKRAGYRVVCAEDVFVHHFGQGSIGELCVTGEYDRVLEANRKRFETKWGLTWQPHGRRLTPGYQNLRDQVVQRITSDLPSDATVVVVSKGDEELLRLGGRRGWHFPQLEDGSYAAVYPANSAEAIAHLESLRAKRAGFLVIPKPAFWWLEYYRDFKKHLESRYHAVFNDDETCFVIDLRGGHA
jgi:GT2 family glycosyltransferase